MRRAASMPSRFGHLHVEDHDVGLRLARERDGFEPVTRLTAHDDAFALEQLFEVEANDRLVFGDQNVQAIVHDAPFVNALSFEGRWPRSASRRSSGPKPRATAPSRSRRRPFGRRSTAWFRSHPALRSRLLEGDGVPTYLNVFVDGDDIRLLGGLDAAVSPESTILLLPAVAGGAPTCDDAVTIDPPIPGR